MLIHGGTISSGRSQHLLGRRRVLDELDQIVLVDDLARRGGDVLADLEGLHVGHADRELPLPRSRSSAGSSGPSPGSRRRSRASRAAPRDWSARSSTAPSRRRTGAYRSRPSCAVLSSSPSTSFTVVLQPARGQQVGLLDEVEDDLVLPRRVLEALVARGGLDHRLDRLAQHPPRGRLPQRSCSPATARSAPRTSWAGLRHHPRRHVDEGVGRCSAGRPCRRRLAAAVLLACAEEVG